MFLTVFGIVLLTVGSDIGVLGQDITLTNTDAQIWFFDGLSFNQRVIYNLVDAAQILNNSVFNNSRATVLYIHGLNESPAEVSVQIVINAYLINGRYNTLFLDWQRLASAFYPFAVQMVTRLGTDVASSVLSMIRAGLNLPLFHLVGHSLGGQMSGYIGRNIQAMSNFEIILPRISALDPAGPLYYPEVNTTHIRETDAVFVDVIHTDAGGFGSPLATGTADFWPNGGKRYQPGCQTGFSIPMSQDNRCSDARSWGYWAESVSSTEPDAFLSAHAINYTNFQNGDFDSRRFVNMGLRCPTNITNSWYLQTNTFYPYSRGRAGLFYMSQRSIIDD